MHAFATVEAALLCTTNKQTQIQIIFYVWGGVTDVLN